MLYGSETWPTTKKLEENLLRSYHRIIRIMCRVTLQTHIPSDYLHKCSLVDIRRVLKRNRLRIFGNVARRASNETLVKIRLLEAPGRRLPGRPRKTGAKNIEEDLIKAGAMEEDAMNRDEWRVIINRLTS